MSERDAASETGGVFDVALGYIGAFALFSVMALTSADVVMRYFFGAPIKGAFEITELMLVVLIYAGFPLVSRKNMHVTTDFVDRILSLRARRVLAVVIHTVCAAAFMGAAWLIWVKAGKTAGTGLTTTELHIKVAPFVYLICGPILATALIHISKALRAEVA